MKHAALFLGFLLSTGHNTGQGGAGLLVRRGPIMILIFEIVWN